MLRYSLLADLKVLADFSNRAWPVPNQSQDGLTARLRERPQDCLSAHCLNFVIDAEVSPVDTCTSIYLCVGGHSVRLSNQEES